MRNIDELKTTTNRTVYNRAYKKYLEVSKGEIRCSYCNFHKGENFTEKAYGGFDGEDIRQPNWKLVSKNRKQWMKKPLKKEITLSRFHNNNYIEIIV